MSVVKNTVKFEDFKHCLFDTRPVMRECNTLRSYHRGVYSITTNTVALSAFDDKRYLVDNTLTLPYGWCATSYPELNGDTRTTQTM